SSGRADRALDDSKHLVGRRKSEDRHFVQAFQNFVCLQAPHTLYENVRKFAYVDECPSPDYGEEPVCWGVLRVRGGAPPRAPYVPIIMRLPDECCVIFA